MSTATANHHIAKGGEWLIKENLIPIFREDFNEEQLMVNRQSLALVLPIAPH
jgi:hypothetical protein